MNKRKKKHTILDLRINNAGAVENGDILSTGAQMNIINRPITNGLDDKYFLFKIYQKLHLIHILIFNLNHFIYLYFLFTLGFWGFGVLGFWD